MAVLLPVFGAFVEFINIDVEFFNSGLMDAHRDFARVLRAQAKSANDHIRACRVALGAGN